MKKNLKFIYMALFITNFITTLSWAIGMFTDLGLAVKGSPITSVSAGFDTTGTKLIIYGATGPNFSAAELIGYDPDNQLQYPKNLPDDMTGIVSMVTTHDGTIYGGAEFPARLWAYNPFMDDTIRIVGVIDPGALGIWSLTYARDSKIYIGLEPDAEIYVYDPLYSTFSSLGSPIPNEWIVRSMDSLPDGRIVFGTGTTAHLAIYDPSNGSILDLYSEPISFVYSLHYATDGYVYAGVNSNVIVLDPSIDSIIRVFSIPTSENPISSISSDSSGNIYFSTSPTGLFLKYNYALDSLINLGSPVFGDDAGLTRLPDNRICGISGDGIVFIYDPDTDTFSLDTIITSPNSGQGIASLIKGPDGHLYGGTRINHHFFRLDTSNNSFTDFGRPNTGAGEVHTMTLSSTENVIYLGSFTGARLSKYNIFLPWLPGSDATSNPRWIGQIAPGQTWPITMVTAPDEKIYIGTEPDFGGFDGHLVVYNPQDDSLTDKGVIFPYHHIHSMVVNPANGLIYGSTTPITNGTYGGDSFIPPYLFIYDYSLDSILQKIQPFDNEFYINGLTALPDGRVYGGTSPEGRLFYISFDTSTITTNILLKPLSLTNVISDLTKDTSVNIWGVSGDQLFHVETNSNLVSDLGRPEPGEFLVKITLDNQNTVYMGSVTNGHIYTYRDITTGIEMKNWEFFY